MKFSDIIGNNEAIGRLRSLVDSDKIPHALLLEGPAGVPKLALAQATAQYIHCTNRQNGDSCCRCPSCLQHQSFNHVDTHFSFPIFKKSGKVTYCNDYLEEWKKFLSESPIENYERWLTLIKNENGQPRIYTDESEQITRKLSLTSYSSKYKIHIMWLPEKMQPQCANALLKIIEEPYPNTVFILVSDSPANILPTIYSRLQRIELKRLSTQAIAQYLHDKYGIETQDAISIASQADGNISMAISATEHDSENKDFNQDFISLMRLSYAADLKSLRQWAARISDYKREKSCRFLTYASRMIRENYIYNLHVEQLNYLSAEEASFSQRFAPFINELNVQGIIRELQLAERDIKANANGKMVLFDLAVKMTILIKKKK